MTRHGKGFVVCIRAHAHHQLVTIIHAHAHVPDHHERHATKYLQLGDAAPALQNGADTFGQFFAVHRNVNSSA